MVDGVEVVNDAFLETDEIRYCIRAAEEKAKSRLSKITLRTAPGRKIEVTWETVQRKFERIRRITGYLVGTIDRWNNAKQSEEKERIKHI